MRESAGVLEGSAKKEIYLTFKIPANVPSILCGQEIWRKIGSTGLLLCKQQNSEK